jgi:hypothetical protein
VSGKAIGATPEVVEADMSFDSCAVSGVSGGGPGGSGLSIEARIEVICLNGEGLNGATPTVGIGELSKLFVLDDGEKVWSTETIFLRLADAFSAAEIIMPASSAFINTNPGGSELLLWRETAGRLRGIYKERTCCPYGELDMIGCADKCEINSSTQKTHTSN